MERRTNLLIVLGEWWEEVRVHRQAREGVASTASGRLWLPTPGNAVFTVAFTLLVIAGLLWAQSVGAITLGAPLAAGASTGTIAYQGRLADTGGAPLTGTYNMIFRLYAAASGGAPLWEEQWTGASSVQVSDGLFNVMLGSLTPVPQAVISGNPSLFLGITIGTDSEMAPRVQLGSVPFAMQALTVPDGSITTAKLADGAVTSAKLDGANIPRILGNKSCDHCASFTESVTPAVYDVKGANAQDPIQVTVITSGAPLFVSANTYVGASSPVSAIFCGIGVYQGSTLVKHIDINGVRASVSTMQCAGGYLIDGLPAGTYTFKSRVYVESATTLTWDHYRQIVIFEY